MFQTDIIGKLSGGGGGGGDGGEYVKGRKPEVPSLAGSRDVI